MFEAWWNWAVEFAQEHWMLLGLIGLAAAILAWLLLSTFRRVVWKLQRRQEVLAHVDTDEGLSSGRLREGYVIVKSSDGSPVDTDTALNAEGRLQDGYELRRRTLAPQPRQKLAGIPVALFATVCLVGMLIGFVSWWRSDQKPADSGAAALQGPEGPMKDVAMLLNEADRKGGKPEHEVHAAVPYAFTLTQEDLVKAPENLKELTEMALEEAKDGDETTKDLKVHAVRWISSKDGKRFEQVRVYYTARVGKECHEKTITASDALLVDEKKWGNEASQEYAKYLLTKLSSRYGTPGVTPAGSGPFSIPTIRKYPVPPVKVDGRKIEKK